MSFAKNIDKNYYKTISRNLSAKYNQKDFEHAKQPDTYAAETASKKLIPKAAEASGDLTDNRIANNITVISRKSPQNSSETVECKTENT